MRKNNGFGKKVNGESGLYIGYVIRGLNQSRLLTRLIKNDVDVFEVKRISPKKISLYVRRKDIKKFFAITRELCYNEKDIKAVGETGAAIGFKYLLSHVGALLGAIIFIISAVIADDVVFSYSFTGSGAVYSREVEAYLTANGAPVFGRFSKLDLDSLSGGILADGDKFSFVSCEKKGNRLAVELILKQTPPTVLSGNAEFLAADEDGVIVSIKVYRGTAVKAVGEAVSAGEIIVDGFAAVKEETVEVLVIATAVIECERAVEYRSAFDNDETAALIFALEEIGENNVRTVKIEKTPDGGEFIYNVKLGCLKTLFAG